MSKSEKYARTKYTGIYCSWYAMKQRCDNPNYKQFKDYGGRGISYSKEWKFFENFKKDLGSSYKKGLTLDRKDNNLGYSFDNCRWASRQEQSENKRCNIKIEYAGQVKTLLEWWKYLKIEISYDTLRSRFYRGMSPEAILETGLYRPWKLT